MFSKKLWIAIFLSIFFYGVAFSQGDSFIKKGSYHSSVRIDNPETSLLAEVLLRNGINVTSSYPHFHFKTTDSENSFAVFIYYETRYSNDFVGKFVYEKKNTTDETREFVNAFVSWMSKNAWSKK